MTSNSNESLYKPSSKTNSLKTVSISGSTFFKVEKTNTNLQFIDVTQCYIHIHDNLNNSIEQLKNINVKVNDLNEITDSQINRLNDLIKTNRRNCIEMVRQKMKKDQLRQQYEDKHKSW
ncbi:Hypothetical_protein [Hexamita inflata]|uniref:Hypothetical_protein n=1 Tax=Hexamita inflata TaxID=28002 RepID=A0ABP1HNF9_9EUKA